MFGSSCALIINELVQNAVEHAFAGLPGGSIVVRLAEQGDSLYIEDLDEFVRGTSDPEVQRQLYEDEIGHLDHSSWRGAFTDRI